MQVCVMELMSNELLKQQISSVAKQLGFILFLWGIFVGGVWVEHVNFNSLVGEAVKTIGSS